MLQIGLLLFTGATSSPDEFGRFRVIVTASPYPGWFYALPLLVATILLAVAVWLALRRIATTASLPGVGLKKLDNAWRMRSAQIVVRLTFAAVCFQLGGTAVFAGVTMANAFGDPGAPVGWQVLATCLTVTGVLALLASVVALTLAGTGAAALTRQISASDVETERLS